MAIGSWFLGVGCWSDVGVANVLGSCWLLPASICKRHMSPLFFRPGHVALVVGVAGDGGVAVVAVVAVVCAVVVAVVLQFVVACCLLVVDCCLLFLA